MLNLINFQYREWVRATLDMIFAVFDELLAVNMCINYSFVLHLYLQFYYCRTYLKFKKAGHVLALDGDSSGTRRGLFNKEKRSD